MSFIIGKRSPIGFIEMSGAPKVHGDIEGAYKELSRLASLHSGYEFVLFVAIAHRSTPVISNERPASAPQVEPKVFRFEAGDVVTKITPGSLYLWRGGNSYFFSSASDLERLRFTPGQRRLESEVDLTRPEIKSHLATLGYKAVWPQVEPVAEKDKFGREIIERLGGAFIVKSGDGFMVSRPDGLWWDGDVWHGETDPHNPWATKILESQNLLPSAAKSLAPPAAQTALENPKVEPRFDKAKAASTETSDVLEYTWSNLGPHTKGESFLFGTMLGLQMLLATQANKIESLESELTRQRRKNQLVDQLERHLTTLAARHETLDKNYRELSQRVNNLNNELKRLVPQNG